MNVFEWAVGFILTYDLVALVCLSGYLWNRRIESGEIHYTFVLCCLIFLLGKTISRIAMFVTLWPIRHEPITDLWHNNTAYILVSVDSGIVITLLGALLVVRFIGKLVWGTEWLWVGTGLVGIALPQMLDYAWDYFRPS